MIFSDFIIQTNSAYRGSNDNAPTNGAADYTLWLQTTNRKISEWAKDGKNTWRSLWRNDTLTPVVTVGLQTYSLLTDVLESSDDIQVRCTDGQTDHYTLVKPQERGSVPNSCYITGAPGSKVLNFYDPIVTGAHIVGGTINLAGYFIPADLTGDSSVIPVDDPYWLVYAVAAELSFNDLTYEDKAPDLVAKANNLFEIMALNNRRGSYKNARILPTAVTRIPGSNR